MFKLIVFGDSISDTGNLFALFDRYWLTCGIRMSTPPSAHGGGVFSNGPLIVERIAQHYGEPLHIAWGRHPGNNYAVSNAAIFGNYDQFLYKKMPFLYFNQFSLAKQIDRFLKDLAQGDHGEPGNKLCIVACGGNDAMLLATSEQSASTLSKTIASIGEIVAEGIAKIKAQCHGSQFVIFGVPDIGLIPAFYGTVKQEEASEVAWRIDEAIGQKVTPLSNVLYLPVRDVFRDLLQKWDGEQRLPCVQDVANGYLPWLPLLFKRTMEVKFIHGKQQKDLDEGNGPFYDYFHGSSVLYADMAAWIIKEMRKCPWPFRLG